MRTLVVVGSDKIGKKAINRISDIKEIKIILDRSSNISRIIKLLRKGLLPFKAFLLMFKAEIIRKPINISDNITSIKSNKELYKYIEDNKIQKVILFRAGLIINKSIIDMGIPILNIHCAKIPQYAGLASIYRALKEREFKQSATLHKVISKIDSGQVLMTRDYEMSPKNSYFENEELAYNTGIDLLEQILRIKG